VKQKPCPYCCGTMIYLFDNGWQYWHCLACGVREIVLQAVSSFWRRR